MVTTIGYPFLVPAEYNSVIGNGDPGADWLEFITCCHITKEEQKFEFHWVGA